MVAFVGCFNELPRQSLPTTMAGQMPAGFTLLRDDVNPGIGSLHGPLYVGICYKQATLADIGATFVWTMGVNPGDFCPTFVSLAVARGSSGIGPVALTALGNSPNGKITAAGSTLPTGKELVFVAGLWGTGSGSIISSDSNLPLAMPQDSIQSTQAFYQYGANVPGTVAPPQVLSCTNINDAFTAYQVTMLGM